MIMILKLPSSTGRTQSLINNPTESHPGNLPKLKFKLFEISPISEEYNAFLTEMCLTFFCSCRSLSIYIFDLLRYTVFLFTTFTTNPPPEVPKEFVSFLIRNSRWSQWPLIGRNIFHFFSRTTSREGLRLARDVTPWVLKQCCYFSELLGLVYGVYYYIIIYHAMSNLVHGEMYSIQHYVIKFVSDLRQVDGFLRVLRFPSLIKLTTTI